jgi:hypothetical protein
MGDGEMFVSLETSDFRDAMREPAGQTWSAIATDLLQRNDRNVAVGKIADALQLYAVEQPVPEDEMLATLYSLALRRVDYYTLALELVQSAEVADPSLVREPALDGELTGEDLLAA